MHQERDDGKLGKYKKILFSLLALLQSSFGVCGSLGFVGSVAFRALTVNAETTNVPVGGGGTKEFCDDASTGFAAARREKVAEVYI